MHQYIQQNISFIKSTMKYVFIYSAFIWRHRCLIYISMNLLKVRNILTFDKTKMIYIFNGSEVIFFPKRKQYDNYSFLKHCCGIFQYNGDT